MRNGTIAALLVVGILAGAGAGFFVGATTSSPTFTSTSTSVQTTTITLTRTTTAIAQTSSTSTCSGYPPGGDCIAPYSYTFTISVNYNGPWKMSYHGETNVGEANETMITGNRTGNGFYSTPVTLAGLNDEWLTLCAQAQKLDASNSTLILTVTGSNETSLPYGSVSYCGGVVP